MTNYILALSGDRRLRLRTVGEAENHRYYRLLTVGGSRCRSGAGRFVHYETFEALVSKR